MTIRFILTLAVEGEAAGGGATTRAISAAVERSSLTAETLGLTLAEGKAILAELQAAVVAEQVAAHEAAARRCLACGTDRGIKGHHSLTCRTAFGTLPLTATRLRRCRCAADRVAGDRASFSPLADLLPGRTTPELLYLETRWGALVSYGLAARMLGDVLLMDRPVSPERVRRHLHAVAAGEEAVMGEEPDGAVRAWSGCQRDLDEMPPPDGPAYVGVDGGFVRDRAGSWFEVVDGKSVPGFRRNAPEDCPRRRLLDVLASQGYAPNQKLVDLPRTRRSPPRSGPLAAGRRTRDPASAAAQPTTPSYPIGTPVAVPAPSNTNQSRQAHKESSQADFVNGLLGWLARRHTVGQRRRATRDGARPSGWAADRSR